MQLSHVTALWLRLAGNILLDLFLFVHMFCSPVAHEIIRRSILLPLQGLAALTVEVTRPRGCHQHLSLRYRSQQFGQSNWDYFLAAFAAIRARNCFSF